jgi:hypothetical protein
MGRRVNVSGRTIRRHRKALADQGLIEVLGHGKDHKPACIPGSGIGRQIRH